MTIRDLPLFPIPDDRWVSLHNVGIAEDFTVYCVVVSDLTVGGHFATAGGDGLPEYTTRVRGWFRIGPKDEAWTENGYFGRAEYHRVFGLTDDLQPHPDPDCVRLPDGKPFSLPLEPGWRVWVSRVSRDRLSVAVLAVPSEAGRQFRLFIIDLEG